MARKIVSTPIEHPSVMATLAHLQSRGVSVDFVPVDRLGRVVPAAIEAAIDSTAFLVCCMLANNEIGTLNPIGQIGRLCKERGILFHTDATQALGKVGCTVPGYDDDGKPVKSDGSATVTILDVLPTAQVTKSVDWMLVTYRVVVQNTSVEPLYLEDLVDNQFGNLNGKGSCRMPQVIPVSGNYTCTFDAWVTM
jgi:hypothetical protein